VTLNGERLMPRKSLHTFDASLETVVADEDGVMRLRVRKTKVSIYESQPGEVPSLYEMGLPIVETGDKWHIDVRQKVPPNRDRNNVRPGFLRTVRTLVLNEMSDRLTADDANDVWVRQASSDSACSEKAIKRVLDLRFGEKRAAYDMTDPEANKTWVPKGGTLVYGAMMNAQEWKNAKEAGAIEPAGRLCPTPKPYSDDPNDPPLKVIPESEWTGGMRNIGAYAEFPCQGTDGGRSQGRCDRATKTISILDGMAGDDLLALLIHEIAHATSNDYHGGLWLRRMEEAASHAERNGAAGVAALLREQIASYRDEFRVTAAMVYGEIDNCVIDQPHISFSEVVDFLRRDFGLSRGDLLRRFRRAERVFEQAKRDVRETAERRASWLRQQDAALSTST
jgi:hypothetical protein